MVAIKLANASDPGANPLPKEGCEGVVVVVVVGDVVEVELVVEVGLVVVEVAAGGPPRLMLKDISLNQLI